MGMPAEQIQGPPIPDLWNPPEPDDEPNEMPKSMPQRPEYINKRKTNKSLIRNGIDPQT
jgi:hypothetical protein